MDNAPSTEKSVLIVDDSVEYLNFMRSLLEGEGFRAAVASSTAALQDQLRADLPDLVIADVRLPGEDAFAVLDLLAANERTATIPVLLCTGAVQEVEAGAARLQQEGIEVLFKPFDIDQLLCLVTRLSGRAARSSA